MARLKKFTEKQFKELYSEWEKSGLSQVDFCVKKKISIYTFKSYRKQYNLVKQQRSPYQTAARNNRLEKLHSEYEASGLNIAEFCRSKNIKPDELYRYRFKKPTSNITPIKVEALAKMRTEVKDLQTKEGALIAPDFLTKAVGHLQDRATTYDNPEGERSMAKTVGMFNVLTGSDMSEEQGWKFMTLLKLVRSEQGAFKADNYEDLSAYGALAGETASKNRK